MGGKIGKKLLEKKESMICLERSHLLLDTKRLKVVRDWNSADQFPCNIIKKYAINQSEESPEYQTVVV